MRKIVTLLLVVGLFSNLFGQMEKDDSISSGNRALRLEYNVMKNISLEKLERYENPKRYKQVEDGIYLDLHDNHEAKYRMTISYELESDETNNQYPLEDILDKYLLHVSDFLESENRPGSNKYKFEFGGYLGKMIVAKEIIGKKVFNREFRAEDGQIRVELVIE